MAKNSLGSSHPHSARSPTGTPVRAAECPAAVTAGHGRKPDPAFLPTDGAAGRVPIWGNPRHPERGKALAAAAAPGSRPAPAAGITPLRCLRRPGSKITGMAAVTGPTPIACLRWEPAAAQQPPESDAEDRGEHGPRAERHQRRPLQTCCSLKLAAPRPGAEACERQPRRPWPLYWSLDAYCPGSASNRCWQALLQK